MTKQPKITVVIVDDELLARRSLRGLLQPDAEITVAGEAKNGREACDLIRKTSPDLVFLDVQMPEMNGFEVLLNLDSISLPNVIFVTAYDQYALKAFEFHALDYLLKPFDDERFNKALIRAKHQIKQENDRRLELRLAQFIEDLRSRESTSERKKAYAERIPVRSSGRIYFLPVCEIDWIEASDQYVTIHSDRKSYLIRESMNQMEAQLPPNLFFRIHRSTLVNLQRVKEMQITRQGEGLAILADGTNLRISRNRRQEFESALTQTARY